MVMTKQLALSIALLVCLGHVAGHTHAQGTLEQRVSELSKQISDGLTENQKRTIAVVEFVDLKGNVTDFGRFLAEELITRLYQTRKFKVIERQLLNKVVTEQKLSLTGMIDQTSAQKLGRLLGVDAIASGTITDLGKSLRVNARLINTGTGEIFAVAAAEIAKDDSVMKLMAAGDAAPTGSTNPTQPQGPVQRLNTQFITFELLRCRMSGTAVTCDWRFTNNDQDRKFILDIYDSRLFDELGNGYRASNAQLAKESGSDPEIIFISGVTTQGRMTFQEVSPQATKITMLDLRFYIGNEWFNARFRDVPLLKVGPR
jgi:TolB-like protein